jgi:hypothetical protein
LAQSCPIGYFALSPACMTCNMLRCCTSYVVVPIRLCLAKDFTACQFCVLTCCSFRVVDSFATSPSSCPLSACYGIMPLQSRVPPLVRAAKKNSLRLEIPELQAPNFGVGCAFSVGLKGRGRKLWYIFWASPHFFKGLSSTCRDGIAIFTRDPLLSSQRLEIWLS